MSAYHLDRRFSPLGLLAAAGLHVAVILVITAFGAAPSPIVAPMLMAQLIVPEAPPAPVTQPPKPEPVVAPRPVPRKPAAAPRPAPAPEVVAAPSPEPAAVAVAPPEPDPPAPPAPAPAAAPVARAAPEAPAVVSAPRFDADYLHNPSPTYPPLSRRMREEGKVMLRVFVEPDGRPSQVTVKDGSGSPRLDRAAEEAVRRWQFVPARRGSEAVGAWVLVPIVFSLRG